MKQYCIISRHIGSKSFKIYLEKLLRQICNLSQFQSLQWSLCSATKFDHLLFYWDPQWYVSLGKRLQRPHQDFANKIQNLFMTFLYPAALKTCGYLHIPLTDRVQDWLYTFKVHCLQELSFSCVKDCIRCIVWLSWNAVVYQSPPKKNTKWLMPKFSATNSFY